MKPYDTIILGGGPAGYTAAIYALRGGLTAILVEKTAPGGQMATTSRIENYPGFPEISGWELTEKMREQALALGLEERFGEPSALSLDTAEKQVTVEGEVLSGGTVILATGARPRKLELPREEALTGRGVSYCATCDGMFFRGKTVAVVGGGDTAFEDALYLSHLAERVIIIHRRASFRASAALVKRAQETENLTFLTDAVVTALHGEKSLDGVTVRRLPSGEETRLPLSGLFVAVGRVPETELFRGMLAMDEAGYLLAGEDTKTSLPGVFAAGDARTKPLRQIVTACADGACAAKFAVEALTERTSSANPR